MIDNEKKIWSLIRIRITTKALVIGENQQVKFIYNFQYPSMKTDPSDGHMLFEHRKPGNVQYDDSNDKIKNVTECNTRVEKKVNNFLK